MGAGWADGGGPRSAHPNTFPLGGASCNHTQSRTIRLDDEVYERLEAVKRDDETFSEAVERLLSGRSLLNLVGLWSADEVVAIPSTFETVDADARDDIADLVDRLESG